MANSVAEQEFSALFERTHRHLLAQAYLLTGDAQESQDLVQETFLRAWRDWKHVSALENPEAWLRRVLSNAVVGRWRKLRIRRAHAAATASETVSPAPSIGQLDVVTALRSLPASQRTALVLVAFVGLTTAQVAEEMGTSEGTVRVWLSRARASMALALGTNAPPAGMAETDGRR